MEEGSMYFTLTLALELERWQRDRLDKRFRVNCDIYNAMLREGIKRLKQMRQTCRYRALLEKLDGTREEKARKEIYRNLDQMAEKYRLRRYDFSKMAAPYRQHFKDHTDAPVVQNLADQVWRAINDLVCRRGRQVHFKKAEELMCLQGKTNKTSIRYQNGYVIWKGLILPVRRNYSAYETNALSQEIRFCRIKRKWIRGKQRYYVEIVLKGVCPVRQKILPRHRGTIGLDIGFNRLVCVGEHEIQEYPIPVREQFYQLEKEKRRLKRRMERSRKAMNPQNYDSQGKVIPGCFFGRQSINYRKFKLRRRELTRKQILLREEIQRRLIEQCISMGDTFVAERLEYSKMKKRAADGDGKLQLGRAVEQTALASFLSKMEWKMRLQGRQLFFVDPVKTAAASVNHLTEKREKLPAGKETRLIGKDLVARRKYSAFLLRHVEKETGHVDFRACQSDFAGFLLLCKQWEEQSSKERGAAALA